MHSRRCRAGFWLSFVAVGVILLIETTSLVPALAHARALRLQLAVMLALAPLTFAVFGGVSLAGLVVNLLAIPVISFVFVPLVLAGACGLLLAGRGRDACSRWRPGLYEKLWPAHGLGRGLRFRAVALRTGLVVVCAGGSRRAAAAAALAAWRCVSPRPAWCCR